MHALAMEKQATSLLNTAQKNAFQRDGFLILRDFVPADICEHLKKHAQQLISAFDPGAIKTIFTTKDQKHARDRYFLDSGYDIRFFFEENAIDEHGELKFEKSLCINKFGHAMHDLDPVFNLFSRTHKIAALIHDLGLNNPLILQSMYICKQPRIGGEVNCHQDATFLYVKQHSVIGLWFALEDATLENGCLWAIPGGHKEKLKSRFIRTGNTTKLETFDATPWPLEKMVPLEVPRGSVIVLHGLSPHMSKENTSSHSRHAYTLHFMSADADYAHDNWLQRPEHAPFAKII